LCICRVADHERTVAKVPSGAPRPAQSAPPPPFPLSERRGRSESTRGPEADPPVFGGGADLPGIADGLKKAAESGIPFCEECAKASQQRAGARQ
jgi:hypothetical protein